MTVSILGCGWYGLNLAKTLIKLGIRVKGSTTSAEKIETLESGGLEAYLIKINTEEDSIVDPGFFICDTLIIANNVKMNDEESYLKKIHHTLFLIQKYGIKKVIFISSTSIYGDPCSIVDESTPPVPETKSASLLLKAELLFQNCPSFSTVILRFAGLVGPGRDPGWFFAGKKDIPNGLSPVNLVHLDDCIGITEKILSSWLSDGIINVVHPHHPPKSEFYSLAAARSNLPVPSFIPEKLQWKIVNSIQINHLIDYDFRFMNWMDWLRSGES